MNPPTQHEVNDMARMLKILNGDLPPSAPSAAPSPTYNTPATNVGLAGDHVNETDYMKNILNTLGGGGLGITQDMIAHMNRDAMMEDFGAPETPIPLEMLTGEKVTAATSAVDTLVERSINSRELREAMITTETPNGVRIGKWEIVVDSSLDVPAYDVRNAVTQDVIARGLTIYEAAKGIVTALNDGDIINSPFIRKILIYEGAYSRQRDMAVQFRKSMSNLNESKSPAKYASIEDRMKEAINKAEEAKRNLIDHVKTK